MTILIERRLGTAPYWMPVERGWVEPSQEIKIVESLTPPDLRAHDGVMVVDTLLASTVLESSMILTDHAVAAETISLLTMITSSRPDEIDAVAAAVPGISLTGRAVAEIVIPEFYGITVSEWINGEASVGPKSIVVTEDAQALLPTANEDDYHEDLGRAWFLLTETPFVSHVCIVSELHYQEDVASVRAAVADLYALRRAADDQRRLLRRNISRDHDIDRDLVVDVFDGLRFDLTERGVEGLSILYGQTGVLSRIGSLADRIATIKTARQS
jgi:predicted solute-binding protein